MLNQKSLKPIHPLGESLSTESSPVAVDTFDGKVHVEWDPQAAVTPMGQLSFFIDYLKTAELFEPWISECPLHYTSNNASSKRDVLGTILLSVLAGHKRYAHITSIRSDNVNPKLLGMEHVVSEDAVRRAFQKVDTEVCVTWQLHHLKRCWKPLLCESWILDIDTTVKPLYGKQEGAVVGYNPHKPGRPCQVYHTYMMANTRMILDVEVQPGNQGSSLYSRPQLFAFIDQLSPEEQPAFLRGDSGFGNEGTIVEAEERQIDYLFKLRQTKKVKQLIQALFTQAEWTNAGKNWEGTQSRLPLSGWSKERRVIVLRRESKGEILLEKTTQDSQQTLFYIDPLTPFKKYEYAVLVTSLSDEILTIAQHYRDRSDSENVFDELKNQWSWGGFMTQDLHRCQVMARHTALIYNWWSLYVRLVIPEKHSEAVTSRPLLLYAVGQQTGHGRQTKLTLTSMHAHTKQIQKCFEKLTHFLSRIRATAEQLGWEERWRQILSRAMRKFLRGKPLTKPRLVLNTG